MAKLDRNLVAADFSRRQVLVGAAGLVGSAAFLAACGKSSSSSGSGAPSANTTLAVATAAFAKQTWQPWLQSDGESVVQQMVFDKLINVDPATGDLIPGLALAWTLSADSKTWEFTLRPNVPFHGNHGTVTAEDVQFSWQQFTQKASTQNAAALLLQAIDGDIANFEIVSPLKFRVHSSHPAVALAAGLSQTVSDTMEIQSKKYWESDAKAALTHPIGTGPYEFVSATPGVVVHLKARPKHWNGAAYYQNVTVRVIESDAASLTAVESRSVDLSFIPPSLVGEAKAASTKVDAIHDVYSANIFFGGMYPNSSKWDRNAPWIQADAPARGQAIRQAMSMAIDRETILKKVLFGLGTLTTSPLIQFPSIATDMDPAWTAPYDPDQAKKLLAQGGYPHGFEITMPVFAWATQTFSVALAEAAAGYFQAIGLKVKQLPTTFDAWANKTIARSTDGWVMVQLVSFYSEPAQALISTMMPNSVTCRMYDPIITTAVNKLNAEPSATVRQGITHDLLAALNREMLAIPLFTTDNAVAVTSKVGKWTPVPGASQMTNIAGIRP